MVKKVKQKRKLNKVKVKRCALILALIIIVIIGIVIGGICNNNKIIPLSILLDNELITTKNEVLLDGNGEEIYFSKEDVVELFDETLYYNQAEKELITTYDTNIALLKVDEAYAVINDENVKLTFPLKEENGKVYLPLTDLKDVYHLEIDYSAKNNRIIMDSTLKAKKEATVIKRTKLKKSKSIFSKKIEKIIIGDEVTILEESGKYKKIRTQDGEIGYVKASCLSDNKQIRDDINNTKQELNVLKNYSNISGVYDVVSSTEENKINVVTPKFFYMDKDGKVLDKTTSSSATYSVYMNWVQNNSLTVMPIFSNNESVSSSLLSYSQRSEISQKLVELMKKYNFTLVNIEFNSIDDINSFYRFVIEVTPRLKKANIGVAITINNNIDKSRVEKIVDYCIED